MCQGHKQMLIFADVLHLGDQMDCTQQCHLDYGIKVMFRPVMFCTFHIWGKHCHNNNKKRNLQLAVIRLFFIQSNQRLYVHVSLIETPNVAEWSEVKTLMSDELGAVVVLDSPVVSSFCFGSPQQPYHKPSHVNYQTVILIIHYCDWSATASDQIRKLRRHRSGDSGHVSMIPLSPTLTLFDRQTDSRSERTPLTPQSTSVTVWLCLMYQPTGQQWLIYTPFYCTWGPWLFRCWKTLRNHGPPNSAVSCSDLYGKLLFFCQVADTWQLSNCALWNKYCTVCNKLHKICDQYWKAEEYIWLLL